MELKVGQKVWLASRYTNKDRELSESVIEKVGRKWFRINTSRQDYSVADGTQKPNEYGQRTTVWFSKEAYESAVGESTDREILRRSFSMSNLHSKMPIEKIRKILEIIKPYSDATK